MTVRLFDWSLSLPTSGDAGTEPIHHRTAGDTHDYTNIQQHAQVTHKWDSPTPYLSEMVFVQGVMVGRGNSLSVSTPSFSLSISSFLLLCHTLFWVQGCDSDTLLLSVDLSLPLPLFNHFWPQHFNVRRMQRNRNSTRHYDFHWLWFIHVFCKLGLLCSTEC